MAQARALSQAQAQGPVWVALHSWLEQERWSLPRTQFERGWAPVLWCLYRSSPLHRASARCLVVLRYPALLPYPRALRARSFLEPLLLLCREVLMRHSPYLYLYNKPRAREVRPCASRNRLQYLNNRS